MTYLIENTTISVQEAVVTSGGEFLRLSDKKPGERPETDRMTVGQAADTISEIFGKGTCKQPDKPDVYTPPVDPNIPLNQSAADYLKTKFPGSKGVAELAEKFGVQNACVLNLSGTGKKTLPVYFHASSDAVFEDYRLVSYGSASSGPVIVEEDIEIRFEFTRSASLPIYYYIDHEKLNKYLEFPALYGEVFEWRGNPKSNRGERVEPPAVRIQGDQVMLHGYYSGILVVRRLPIKYHRWQITITGTALGDGKREYKGRVSAIASAYNLGPVHQQIGKSETVQDKSAECPIDDKNPLATDVNGDVIVCRRDSSGELVCSGGNEKPNGKEVICYLEVKKELIQQCSGKHIRNLPTEYRIVECPDPVTPTWNSPAALNYNPSLPEYYHIVKTVLSEEYGYEGTTRQITDEEYKSICCHEPEREDCVPYCREIKSTYYGPVDIEGGKQKYIDQYPGKTVFIPVGTEAGPCGTLTNTFVDPSLSCGCKYKESRLVVNFLLGTLEYKIDNGGWVNIGSDRIIFYLPTESITLRLTKTVDPSALEYKVYADTTVVVSDSWDELDRLSCASIDGQISSPDEWPIRELRHFGSRSEVDTWVLSFGYPSGNEDMTDCSSLGWDGWQGLDTSYRGYYIRWGNDYGAGDIGLGERILGAWCKGVCPAIGDVVYERTIEAVC